MAQPAAKQGDQLVSDSSSKVWVQPPGGPPPPPVTVPFAYAGQINAGLSRNVFVMGKPAATVSSTATNATPPASQPTVTGAGTPLSVVDNTGTISVGSSKVFINGKAAARNGDKAKTWDYSTGPAPGVGKEVENGKVVATGQVFIGG
jgi:uncharacterized Zn-binding protein involved in type VI secretion